MMFALLGMVANAQTFQKVTDVAQLAAGDKVVIVYENGAESKAMGASYSTGKYRTDVGVSISAEQFVAPEETAIFTLGKNSDGTFTFNDGTGYLEYNGSSNDLYTLESGNINWTVTNESIVNSEISERYLQYNPSGKRFACYKLSSNQKNVCLYKETITTKVSAPEFSTAEGTYYNPLTIDLSCVTTDASIFYTINDGAETAYEAPIELSESGEYTIKAWATKEGLENSEVVSKTYTLKIGEQPMNISLNILEYGTDKGLNKGVELYEIVYNNVTFVATKGTNPPAYYEDWRIYKDSEANKGTLTVTAPDGYLIESIDFVGTINFGSADSGTFKNGKWSALENTQQVVFGGNTGTTKITSITVILKAPNQVATPTFSLTSGTYEGTQSLTMDCATEGATIYYSVNGGDTQTYADAIELVEGEYAFVAWAEKDGMTKSSEVTANYTIVTPLVANSIAEFLTLGAAHTDREITLNCDLTVTYQGGGNDNNRDLYVKDAAGKGLLIFSYQNPLLNNGNIIPAGLRGKLQDFNGLPELVDPSNLGEVSSGDEVSPEVFTAATITADDLSKYIVLNEVTLTELNNKNGTLTDASGDVVIRDNGYCKYPTDVSKEYDVTAVVAIYRDKENKETIQVYPVEIVEHTSSSVNDAVANEFKAVAVANGIEVNVAEAGLVSVYNAAGQLVANVNVAEGATTINVAAGFYIVKAGNNVAKVLVK